MGQDQISFDKAVALSALDWWVGAGVDVLADDAARDWLRAPTARAPTVLPIAAEPTAALPASTLDALHARLADPALAWAGPPTRRLAPAGDPASGLMIIADQPDAEDADEGRLIGGAAGRLFDRMLAAIGRDRASVYLAPLCPAARVGRMTADHGEAAAALMRSHLALVRPARVLLLGDGTARALLGLDCAAARGRLHQINHDRGSVPAVASLHPRILVRQPALKGESWKDLRLLMELAA